MSKKLVSFFPDNLRVEIDTGQTILQAAAKAGIALRGACGGKKVCGRCRVQVRKGKTAFTGAEKILPEEAEKGWVLACQAVPEDAVEVFIPETSRLTEHRVLLDERRPGLLAAVSGEGAAELYPLFRRTAVKLPAPTLTDNTDDYGRLVWALKHEQGIDNVMITRQVLAGLPGTLRDADWSVVVELASLGPASEIQGVKPAAAKDAAVYGLAVDIGTTTVAVELVDLENGAVSGSAGTYNRQAVFGDDVISRIVYGTETPGGLEELQQAVVETVNGLIAELLHTACLNPTDVRSVVCAGNTTMIHLFLGIDPTYIRLEPYVPAVNLPPPVRAAEVGLKVCPEAWVYCLPGVASYVGGDITAGVKVNGMAEADPLTLFMDIGTNGEMVLGNREWMMACACSAGPAFEGSGIACGMRAVVGAIEAVRVLPGGFEVVYRTVGDGKPIGICGSGLIDALSSLYQAGVIDRGGKFVQGLDTPRFTEGEEGPEFVVAWTNETGHGRNIVLTQADIDNLMRAKAAVFAGIRTLLTTVDLEVEAVERVFIAGGFGRFINIRDAVAIGMLPDVPLERYTYIGNSSLKGARLALLSREVWAGTADIARRITYMELSVGNRFMEEFVSALFLPHTDMNLFHSLQGRNSAAT
ncbi:MAG: ASKHA domain-containing protein [Bacillota bacterium]